MTQEQYWLSMIAAVYAGCVIGAAARFGKWIVLAGAALFALGLAVVSPVLVGTMAVICIALYWASVGRRWGPLAGLIAAWLVAMMIVGEREGVLWLATAIVPAVAWVQRVALGRVAETASVLVSVVVGLVWAVLLLTAIDVSLARGLAEKCGFSDARYECGAHWRWAIACVFPQPGQSTSVAVAEAGVGPSVKLDPYGMGLSYYSLRVAMRGGIQCLTIWALCAGLMFVMARIARALHVDERPGHPEGWESTDESEDGFLRMVLAAIPSLGFLGTVLGISQAMSVGMSQGGGVAIEVVAASLGVAFNTTAVALACGLLLNGACLILEMVRRRSSRANAV